MTPPLRISVADDELDMRDYFLRMLQRRGHQVVSVAETGMELVQQCRDLKPDLVITDVKMPQMDGIAAANAIHSDRPIPVILVSAHYEETAQIQLARPTVFLQKPFTLAELEEAIRDAMRRVDRPSASQNGSEPKT